MCLAALPPSPALRRPRLRAPTGWNPSSSPEAVEEAEAALPRGERSRARAGGLSSGGEYDGDDTAEGGRDGDGVGVLWRPGAAEVVARRLAAADMAG